MCLTNNNNNKSFITFYFTTNIKKHTLKNYFLLDSILLTKSYKPINFFLILYKFEIKKE